MSYSNAELQTLASESGWADANFRDAYKGHLLSDDTAEKLISDADITIPSWAEDRPDLYREFFRGGFDSYIEMQYTDFYAE